VALDLHEKFASKWSPKSLTELTCSMLPTELWIGRKLVTKEGGPMTISLVFCRLTVMLLCSDQVSSCWKQKTASGVDTSTLSSSSSSSSESAATAAAAASFICHWCYLLTSGSHAMSQSRDRNGSVGHLSLPVTH